MCGSESAGIVWIDSKKPVGWRYFTEFRKKRKRKPKKTVIAIKIRGKEVEVEEDRVRRWPEKIKK